MIILFAPSEGKKLGGELPSIDPSAFIFPELYNKRQEVIDLYRTQINKGDTKVLSELFGINNPKEFDRYLSDIQEMKTMKAIERYDGVAYDYLDYQTLGEDAKGYLDQKVIVFSNLFGPIGAGDRIPDYKVKQGSLIGSLAAEKHYKHYFSDVLESYIAESEILDLRAGFYDKFYVPMNRTITMKFLKEGKVVSHWAKAYRGRVLREMALHNVTSMEKLIKLEIEGLSSPEITESKKKIELVYNAG